MLSCPSCAREVADGAVFCGYCGAAMGGPAPGAGETAADTQPAPSYWICPRCSVENTADAHFCYSCGASTPEPAASAVVMPSPFTNAARWRCTTCGELNDRGTRFCYYCGVPAAAAASASPTSTPGVSTGGPRLAPAPGVRSGGQGSPIAAGPPPRSGGSWGRWLVLVAAIIAVAAVGGAIVFVMLHDSGGGTGVVGEKTPAVTDTTPPPTAPETSTESPSASAKDVTYLATARASSSLDPEGGNDYYPANLLDGLTGTCWAEGVKHGYGEGEWIRFDFDETMVLTRMRVMPGYGKGVDNHGVDRWLSNGRLASVELRFSDGSTDQFTFADVRRIGWQTIDLDHRHAKWLQVIIQSVYPHTSGWGDHAAHDTSVSEVQLYGYPAAAGGY